MLESKRFWIKVCFAPEIMLNGKQGTWIARLKNTTEFMGWGITKIKAIKELVRELENLGYKNEEEDAYKIITEDDYHLGDRRF